MSAPRRRRGVRTGEGERGAGGGEPAGGGGGDPAGEGGGRRLPVPLRAVRGGAAGAGGRSGGNGGGNGGG